MFVRGRVLMGSSSGEFLAVGPDHLASGDSHGRFQYWAWALSTPSILFAQGETCISVDEGI